MGPGSLKKKEEVFIESKPSVERDQILLWKGKMDTFCDIFQQ